MACILLFLEKRLRQDKVANAMPANIRLFSKERTPEPSPTAPVSVAALAWTAKSKASVHAPSASP